MLLFKPCENFLLLPPPKFNTTTTTDSKPHLLHLHHVKLHFPPKAHFKSTTVSSSSSSPLSSPLPSDSLPFAAGSSSSSLTIVDFLMESGGFSYVQAIQVIQQKPTLLLDEDKNPRSVIAYFESLGFSKTHISKLISKFPEVLVADVENTLKPNIQIFLDFGFSGSDIADLIASKPNILHSSQNKPYTDEDLISTIKRNMDVLRQHGVPDSEIVHLLLPRRSPLFRSPVGFKRIVQRVVSLGFKPQTKMFSTAVSVMCRLNKYSWDSKMDLLKGLGWSDEQILDAFRKHPEFLKFSSENLKESIEFYKETLNWDVSVLSNRPVILNYSLKKRVFPRYAVLKCLMSMDIIKDNKPFNYMLWLTEAGFLSKYVFKYQDRIPHLYEVYQNECMLGCKEEDNGDIDMIV